MLTRHKSFNMEQKNLEQIEVLSSQVDDLKSKLNNTQTGIFAIKEQTNVSLLSKIMRNHQYIPFSGNNDTEFRNYLSCLRKAKNIYNLDDDQIRALALALSEGSASDWITRFISNNPTVSWEQLEVELQRAFLDVRDKDDIVKTIGSLRRRDRESLLSFSERIFKLAEEAYTPVELESHIVQGTLVNAFIAGLNHNKISEKLTRKKPTTLDEAVKIARKEKGIEILIKNVTFKDPEVNICPLEASEDKVKLLQNEIYSLNEKLTKMENLYKQVQMTPKNNFKPHFQYTNDRRPICFRCQTPGHFQRTCNKRIGNNRNNVNQGSYQPHRQNWQNRGSPNERPFPQ